MQPNFIDALLPGPSWAPWLVLGLTLAVFVAWPVLYMWTKRRAFWRDQAYGLATWNPGVRHVLANWLDIAPEASGLHIHVVREGEQPTGRAAVLLAEGWRPGGTTVWGVTSPRLRYEYGRLTGLIRWLSRGKTGAGPVYEIAVREKPGDPEGAKALAHELAHHVWPHLHGEGMRRRDLQPLPNNPDNWRGHVNVRAGGQWTWSVEDKLLEGLE